MAAPIGSGATDIADALRATQPGAGTGFLGQDDFGGQDQNTAAVQQESDRLAAIRDPTGPAYRNFVATHGFPPDMTQPDVFGPLDAFLMFAQAGLPGPAGLLTKAANAAGLEGTIGDVPDGNLRRDDRNDALLRRSTTPQERATSQAKGVSTDLLSQRLAALQRLGQGRFAPGASQASDRASAASQQRSKLSSQRSRFGNILSKGFGSDFGTQDIPIGFGSDILENFLQQRRTEALQPLNFAQARGNLAPGGFGSALADIDQQTIAGRSQLEGVRSDLATGFRRQLGEGVTRAQQNARGSSLGSGFNPQQAVDQNTALADRLRTGFEGDFLNRARPLGLFSPDIAINTGGQAQGPQNASRSVFDALTKRTEQRQSPRGLGTEGVF